MFRIVVFLSVLAIIACSKTVEIQLEPNVTLIPSKNQELRIGLTSKDNEYGLLRDWLKNNDAGWNSTSGQYPGGVYIVSGDNGIQITKTHVVLYSSKQAKPTATYIQKHVGGELNALREIAQ